MWRLNGMDKGVEAFGETTTADVDAALARGELGFVDVPDWAKQHVMYCKMKDIVNGYSATQYGSNDSVSTQQLCTMVLRWYLGTLSGTDWSYDTAVAKARSLYFVPGYIADSPVIKRGDMAIIMYRAMRPDLIDYTDAEYWNTVSLEPTAKPTPIPLRIDPDTGYWDGLSPKPVATPTPTQTPTSATPMTAAELYAYAEEVVRLVNIERAKEGLRELALKPEMMEVARIKSQDMVDYDYFGHYPKDGSDRVSGNTSALIFNLNIRGLQGRSEAITVTNTPIDAVTNWMESSGHRKILLDAGGTHIGVGVAAKIGPGSYKAVYYTLIVNTWTNRNVDSDARESVQNQPKPVATDPATAYTPLIDYEWLDYLETAYGSRDYDWRVTGYE
jgi:uncharacterized protein YkwD